MPSVLTRALPEKEAGYSPRGCKIIDFQTLSAGGVFFRRRLQCLTPAELAERLDQAMADASTVLYTGEKPPPGVRKLVVCPW